MKTSSRRFIHLAAFFCVLFVGQTIRAEEVPVRPQTDFDIHVLLQNFEWTEDVSPLTLEESGTLAGFGIAGRTRFPGSLHLHFLGKFYAGSVDYDGFLQSVDGSITPYAAETDYSGSLGHLDLSLPLVSREAMEVRPLIGLGGHMWHRALDKSEGYGYDEYWLTVYGRAGVLIDYALDANTKLYGSVAALLTFLNDESAENVPLSSGPIDLEPGEKSGLQAEAGLRFKRLSLAVFHEQFNFGASDLDDSGLFFQPASEMRVTGIRAGVAF